ncbi:MAP7 domain-containing protein 1-like [Amphiprion ocellaris]|uniref:MAP7 domain-containing protein 1-like n=1 Tax=Amphiprion ocellaris TaxID=80972 RepID=UPI002410D5ED|nr:MAP7 domain-containing protein 1-like [Amphiprion ocellaris]
MKRTRKTDGGDKKETKSSPLAHVNDKQAESSKASADYQPKSEVNLPNNKPENGQTNVMESHSVQVVNGVQPMRHENGLCTKEDTAHIEDIIHLTNHGNTTNGARDKSETSMATEPILSFESEESFMKKAGPMKPQHVAGQKKHRQGQGDERFLSEETRQPVDFLTSLLLPSMSRTEAEERTFQRS